MPHRLTVAGDELLPIEQSRTLAATGTPGRVRLIEVADVWQILFYRSTNF